MSNNRPSIEQIKKTIDLNIFVACPNLLIEALTERLDNDWIDMHDTPSDSLLEEDPPEIFEYYLVSRWFGEGMKMIGEPAMELETGIWIWGRTESGLNLEHSGIIGDMIVAWNKKVNNILNT